MTVYIDTEFHCHVDNPNNEFREVETNFFNGKCAAFIEGYMFVPEGESRVSEDGTVYTGEMIAPWRDYKELDNAQREYERAILADAENALAILLGGGV